MLVNTEKEIETEVIKALRHLYWETDEYVKDIANELGIKQKQVTDLAGSKKYTCISCGCDCIQEHRASRTERYYDQCRDCIYIDSATGRTQQLLDKILFVKKFLENKDEVIKEVGKDGYMDILIKTTRDYSRIEDSFHKTTYRLSRLETIKNTLPTDKSK